MTAETTITTGTAGTAGTTGRANAAAAVTRAAWRRVPRSVVAAVAVVTAASCAKIAPPEGARPDRAAPELVATRPESLEVLTDFKGAVEFRFNKVISEGNQPNEGLGTGDLEKLILLSPTNDVPRVGWHRTRITVKPREGWKPGRIYRVQLLPGVMDLRSNRMKTGTILTFSTGAPIPAGRVEGIVTDWTTGQPVRDALIEATLLPDSLTYRGLADSTGYFRLEPLPEGAYLVAAVIDQNRNLRRDFREPWDSVHYAGKDAPPAELWVFPRDTVGPRVKNVAMGDSVAVIIEFNGPLDPDQEFIPPQVRIRRLPDSTQIGIVAVVSKPRYDSLAAQRRQEAAAAALPQAARSDSARRADSIVAAKITAARKAGEPAKPTARITPKPRPPLFDRIVAQVPTPLPPDTRYTVEVFGIRNASGFTSDTARGALVIPKPPVRPDSARADSAATARPDSARVRPDSTRRR
ncbi:MAG: Ig-like domain-containing protein [Gemmatimonadota bacterium]